jgi:hypothetical protein
MDAPPKSADEAIHRARARVVPDFMIPLTNQDADDFNRISPPVTYSYRGPVKGNRFHAVWRYDEPFRGIFAAMGADFSC